MNGKNLHSCHPSSVGGRQFWRGWLVVIPLAAVAIIAVMALMSGARKSLEAGRRASSQNNLRQFGLVMKMYSSDHRGEYPPLAPYEGVWMADLRCLIPKYVRDVSIFFSPLHSDHKKLEERMRTLLAQDPVDWEQVHRVAAQHYVYTGWVLTDADDLPEFMQGFHRLTRNEYSDDVVVGERKFFRLREGVERFYVTDINNPSASAPSQSEIPVMFEHVPRKYVLRIGMDVLYMDGHANFVELGRKFPALIEAEKAFPPPPLE
jgi:hypothetical protein